MRMWSKIQDILPYINLNVFFGQMHELKLLCRGELSFGDRYGTVLIPLGDFSRDANSAPGTTVLSTIFKYHRAWEEVLWIDCKVRHSFLIVACGNGWSLRWRWRWRVKLHQLFWGFSSRWEGVKSHLLRESRWERGTHNLGSIGP